MELLCALGYGSVAADSPARHRQITRAASLVKRHSVVVPVSEISLAPAGGQAAFRDPAQACLRRAHLEVGVQRVHQLRRPGLNYSGFRLSAAIEIDADK